MLGGINVYLQQRWALFRHTPWFFDRLFDNAVMVAGVGREQDRVSVAYTGEAR